MDFNKIINMFCNWICFKKKVQNTQKKHKENSGNIKLVRYVFFSFTIKTFFLSLFFVLMIMLVFTACKFEKLGLISDGTVVPNTSEGNDTSSDSVVETLNEQGFYDLRNLQKDKNPLTDLNVRKAILYSVDRERIIKELFGDYGSILNSLFPPDTDYFSSTWDKYSYDPVLAREYLNKAGYNESNPLFLTIGANSESPSRQIIENIIKENLQDIGIITWIANKDSREWYMDDIKNGNYDLGIWSILIPDSKMLKNYFSSDKIPTMETDINQNCYNFYWYNNQDFDFYMDPLFYEDNMDEKINTVGLLQGILSDNAVILPLYNRIFTVAYNNKLLNIEIDGLNGSFLKNITGMDIDVKETGQTQGKSNSTLESENIKSMVAGFEQEPYILNPFIADIIYRDYLNTIILQGLWKKTGPDKYEPVLVESIDVDGEGNEKSNSLRYSLKAAVKLKNNIYWQDGEPIIADDVVATINAIMSDTTLTFVDKNYSIIKSIEKTGEKEFVVTFNEFDSNWQQLFNFIFPVDLLQDKAISSIFAEDIFGSGPYKLKEWKKGEYILLEKNNYYSGEKPLINEIKFLFNSDINFLIGMLKDGNIDILSIPTDLEIMETIEEDKNLDLVIQPGYLFEHLAICQKLKQ